MTVLLIPPFVGEGQTVEPGVDIATPRVAISTVNDSSFAFHPANLVVEQGDYVRWEHTGVSLFHTTTSGGACVGNGIWNATLYPGTIFTRQFPEPPGGLPYFCAYHCYFYGMTGQVVVTTLIDLTASETSGLLTLAWTGGSGLYRVFRSDNPGFNGAVVIASNTTQTSLTDQAQPLAGQALFYLVMN